MNIDQKKCNACDLCVKVCTPKAINRLEYAIDDEHCMKCYHCMAICPQGAITDQGRISADLQPNMVSPSDFENLIYHRRTHRHFTEKEIPAEIINKLLDLIRYAPTGTNSQNVYITILNSRDKVKLLSDKIMRLYAVTASFLLSIFVYPFFFLINGKMQAKKLKYFKKFIEKYFDGENILSYNAPSLLIFHTPKRSITGNEDGPIWSTTGMLYAETLGLSSCLNGFITKALNHNHRIKKFLNIPGHHQIHSSLLLGYPALQFKRNVFRSEAKVNFI